MGIPRILWPRRSHAKEYGRGEKGANDEGFNVDVFHKPQPYQRPA